MLSRCFKAELSKMLRGKGIYIAIAIMLLLVILLIAMSNLLEGAISMPGVDNGTNIVDLVKQVPRDQYDYTIALLRSQLDMLERENNTIWSRFADQRAQYKSYISIFEYLKAHEEVDVKNLEIPLNMAMDISRNAYGFMLMTISLAFQIAIFYGVIMMSSVLAGESKDGTLRMQLLRPNSRNAILTAKWLATFVVSIGIFLVGVIIGAVYAGAHFGFGATNILCVIASQNVFLLNENVFLFIDVLISLLGMFALIQFSAFMCAISNYNRSASLAVPIIVLLFGNTSAYLLQVIYLGVLDFANNINLLQFIVPTSQTLAYTSLYTALPILLTYIAIFMTVSYVKFNRSEL